MSLQGPVFSSNFGRVFSKWLSFGAENRPFLSSCERPFKQLNVSKHKGLILLILR